MARSDTRRFAHTPYHLLFITFLVAVVLLVGLRTVLLVARRLDTRTEKQELEIAAFVSFIVATAGLVGHAIFVPISGAEKWQPLFDATTLGWALLADRFCSSASLNASVQLRSRSVAVLASAVAFS